MVAGVRRAAARKEGLSWRPAARRPSTVAPSDAPFCATATAGGPAISSARQATRTGGQIPARAPDRDACDAVRMSLRQIDGYAAAHRFGLALHFRGEGQRPGPGHAGVNLQPIDAGLG